MNNIFSQEPEIAVLNILINDPTRYFELDGIKSFMLSSEANQIIFDEYGKQSLRGVAPDPTLLVHLLDADGKLSRSGGAEYINYLKSQSINPINLQQYVSLVVDSYKARTLVETSAKISAAISSGASVDDVISDVRCTLDGLGTASAKNDTVLIGEILSKSFEKIRERASSGELPGVKFLTSAVDLTTGGVMPGDLWIVAGRPGSGKSAVACNAALRCAKNGDAVVIFSLEMPRQTINERLLAIESGVPITNIRLGLLKESDLEALNSAVTRLENLPIYIDTNYNSTLEYILGVTKRLKNQKNVRIGFLDYIQLLAERNTEATHELGKISRALKLLANELGMGFVILSQLNRGVELRDDKRPILSDLRQSGNLEEDADVVAMLYRDDYYNSESKQKGILEFIIRKQRNGPSGIIALNFDDSTNIVKE